ncbi:phosphoribosyltransferase family protein [Proteinivorax hydrogeniformans]|uniref:Phosphoribosyltransferase family protein n=1 Tax=Proteinivorax hydrogeniformans TaxID=1826727 RepID=A0AAU8HUX4_9FIRM
MLALRDAFFSVMFPDIATCIGCKRKALDITFPLCSDCHQQIEYYDPKLACIRCGRSYHGGKCPGPNIGHVMALAPYRGYWKEIINLYKFKNYRYLHKGFSKKISQVLKSNLKAEIDLITYVPVTDKGLKERGFDQSHLIAKHLSKEIKIPFAALLHKNDDRPPQRSLDRTERLKGWEGVLSLNQPDKLQQKHILIIDDIYTTGSTLYQCSKKLKAGGAKKITAFTLAN